MRRALLAVLLLASGCRIERREDRSAPAPRPAAAGAAVLPPAETPAAVPTASETPSGLVVPVAGIRPEDLVDTFDDARSEGRIHDALDILAPRGTPVLAAHAGTLARLFTSERGGLTVYVTDGRTVYYYAHLDAYAPGLAAGQPVARGQVLGAVGSTGNASPEAPHLHFAIWTAPDSSAFWDGAPLNPYPLLTGVRLDSVSSRPATPLGR